MRLTWKERIKTRPDKKQIYGGKYGTDAGRKDISSEWGAECP